MKKDRVSSFIFLLMGVGISIASLPLDLGTLKSPGPGFWPFWSGTFLWVSSITVFLANLKIRETSGKGWVEINLGHFFIVLTSMAAFAYLLNALGFVTGIFLMMLVLYWLGEPRNIFAALWKSAVTSAVSYFVFDKWLQLSFPKGFLGI